MTSPSDLTPSQLRLLRQRIRRLDDEETLRRRGLLLSSGEPTPLGRKVAAEAAAAAPVGGKIWR